jgi:hypothetical protein
MHALYALKRRNTMSFDLATRQYTRSTFLPRRGSLVLDGAEGTVISVDSGCLWVTLENDPRDVVLGKGMRFEVDRRGRTVVVAEEDSSVRLTLPPGILQRMVDALALATKRAVVRSAEAFDKRAKYRRVPHY